MSIKIILADDHEIIREGIRSLLEKNLDLEVVGEASDGREAVKLASELKPDVVLLDISMPSLNGIEAAFRIKSESSDIKVIALSMHSENRAVSRMFQAGASGYLLKNCAYSELVQAVRTVCSGQTYISPSVSDVVLKEYLSKIRLTDQPAISILSSREREVLQLLAEGNEIKEVALQLNLSKKTVETHRQHIMSKLNLKNVAELTRFAIREGLVSIEK